MMSAGLAPLVATVAILPDVERNRIDMRAVSRRLFGALKFRARGGLQEPKCALAAGEDCRNNSQRGAKARKPFTWSCRLLRTDIAY
jgi:hypothetical protein